MAGRMLRWSLELAEFDIKYKGIKALKAQVLADFVAEMAFPETTNNNARRWTLYVDGASSSTGSGARIILENREGTLIEVSLSLSHSQHPTTKPSMNPCFPDYASQMT